MLLLGLAHVGCFEEDLLSYHILLEPNQTIYLYRKKREIQSSH